MPRSPATRIIARRIVLSSGISSSHGYAERQKSWTRATARNRRLRGGPRPSVSGPTRSKTFVNPLRFVRLREEGILSPDYSWPLAPISAGRRRTRSRFPRAPRQGKSHAESDLPNPWRRCPLWAGTRSGRLRDRGGHGRGAGVAQLLVGD